MSNTGKTHTLLRIYEVMRIYPRDTEETCGEIEARKKEKTAHF